MKEEETISKLNAEVRTIRAQWIGMKDENGSLMDLIDECYHYLKANPPDKSKMSYSKWQSLVGETDYMREFNAEAERKRIDNNIAEQLKQERNKAIDACQIIIHEYLLHNVEINESGVVGIVKKLESLKTLTAHEL